MSLPPLMQSCTDELEVAHEQAREAGARAAKLEFQVSELEQRLSAIGAEIAQIQSEPSPRLSTEREQALETLRQHDRNVAPLYRHLDLCARGGALGRRHRGSARPPRYADPADDLDTHRFRRVRRLGDAVDWHVLAAVTRRWQGGQGLGRLDARDQVTEVRRYLDGALGSLILTRDPARSGDFLCAGWRATALGDVQGVARPQKRSQSLIGVVRRQAAAAARREELSREQSACAAASWSRRARLMLWSATPRPRRSNARGRSLRSRTCSTRWSSGGSRCGRCVRRKKQSSVRLAAAGREVDAAGLEEEDARQRWTDATTTLPGAGESGEPDARAAGGLAGGRRLHRAVGGDTQPSGAGAGEYTRRGGRPRRGG